MSHRLTGFGFGPIQAGLFVKEAFHTGSFERLVVAEIDPCLVQAVRANDQSYAVNVAHADGIEVATVNGVSCSTRAVPRTFRHCKRPWPNLRKSSQPFPQSISSTGESRALPV